MHKITKYQLITATTLFDLNEVVALALDEGWLPFGSPIICIDEQSKTNLLFGQAMIQCEEVVTK